jgi:DNA polymerase III subunit beta
MNTPSFVVDKSTFLRELSLLLGAIDQRTTIPICSHVLVEAAKDGCTLKATNLELGMTSKCAVIRYDKPGKTAIPAKRLHGFLSSLPECEVAFKVGDNGHISISGASARCRIPGMSAESFPEIPTPNDLVGNFPLLPLARMISRVVYAISQEESRFTLNAALMEVDSASGMILLTATDGHRLAQAAMPTDAQRDRKTLVAHRGLREVQKFAGVAPMDARIEIHADGNHVFFRTGERALLCRNVSGSFPDYKRVVPREMPCHVSMVREQALQAVGRVKSFADERSQAVQLLVKESGISVQAQNFEAGEGEDLLPAVECVGEVHIAFKGDYMADFLRTASTDNVCMRFRDPQSAVVFEPVDERGDESHFCVVMPMRI